MGGLTQRNGLGFWQYLSRDFKNFLSLNCFQCYLKNVNWDLRIVSTANFLVHFAGNFMIFWGPSQVLKVWLYCHISSEFAFHSNLCLPFHYSQLFLVVQWTKQQNRIPRYGHSTFPHFVVAFCPWKLKYAFLLCSIFNGNNVILISARGYWQSLECTIFLMQLLQCWKDWLLFVNYFNFGE